MEQTEQNELENIEEKTITKKKQPKTKLQMEAFEKARLIRIEKCKLKNEKIKEIKETVMKNPLPPKEIPPIIKTETPKKTFSKKTHYSSEESDDEIIVKKRKPKKKKKVIYLEESTSESSSEEEEKQKIKIPKSRKTPEVKQNNKPGLSYIRFF